MITETFASGTVPLPTDTIRVLEEKILLALNAGGGGGGGGGSTNGQVMIYTTSDPTTDGILPTDQTKPAIAYKKDGTGPTFVWNTTGLAWA